MPHSLNETMHVKCTIMVFRVGNNLRDQAKGFRGLLLSMTKGTCVPVNRI